MTRVPIRVRVAAAFAVAMALVLLGTGVFLYGRLGHDLAGALDQDLRLRAQDLSALVREPGRTLAATAQGRLVERGESFAQLVDGDGRVLDATPPIGAHALIDAAQWQAAARTARFFDVPGVPGLDEPARLLATPLARDGRRLVLVVGATRENRAEALRSLRTELLVAGPVALVLATALGFALAGTGLRAVETMRRRAAEISADRPGRRLPVPATGDELERLGATLNAMLARLEAALERERGFVADAGHELRTPLALLRAELDFALHHAEDDAELRAALREASQETDRLVQLASDLLLLAGTQDGRLALRLDDVAARELLESARTRFAWRAEQDGRALAVLAPGGLVLRGDRLRLEQALGNLVDNALRHGDDRIVIEARAADDRVELHVRDDGPGLAAEFVPRAFQRFTRADPSHAGEGAGLGLAIVDAIARAHGGVARAAGADVWLELPAGDRSAVAARL
ncbi:MAG TPA: ATP-binding protein [Solirubrobacteraceae bacterium]|nr:ATP-binding protein [Solirubrobacteraceae bacterium]